MCGKGITVRRKSCQRIRDILRTRQKSYLLAAVHLYQMVNHGLNAVVLVYHYPDFIGVIYRLTDYHLRHIRQLFKEILELNSIFRRINRVAGNYYEVKVVEIAVGKERKIL